MPTFDDQAAWASVLGYIRARTKPQQFETWFAQLRCDAFSGDIVRIAAPNELYRKWIETHYLGMLREGCFESVGSEPRIELVIDPSLATWGAPTNAGGAILAVAGNASAPPSGAAVATLAPPAFGPRAAAATTAVATAAATARPAPRMIGDQRLNPNYVFEEFVVGPSNRLAHAATLAVVENPAHTYNPLFLHGGVGLGKTHLLQAVCHSILAKAPATRLVYLSCETFVNQYIAAIQKGDPESFRDRYRRDVDMLLLDDIHFLASKKVMQEEFFHTFNTLYNAQKQIILSSDSPPQDIPDLEARLVSRFKWGLVAEIEPPHYETKVAIIRAKAKARGRDLEDKVVDFLANALDSNIRELEGAVLKIIVLAGLQNQKIDIPLCQAAVKELTSRPGQVNLSDILSTVATHFHLKVNDLLSKKRSKSIALPRQICMYLARMLTPLSLEEIGGQLGGRDHTTVLYAEGKLRDLKEKSPEMRVMLDKLARELQRS